MIARLGATSPTIAFVLATLIVAVGVAFFVYEYLHPEDEG
jgi:hypothetical protein